MKIEALKYTKTDHENPPSHITLKIDCEQDLEEIKKEASCAVYVITDSDRSKLIEFKTIDKIIHNCGKKDNRKGLAEYLLKSQKISVLKGQYPSSKQINRSIRALIEKMPVDNICNTSIIGIRDDIFAELYKGNKSVSPKTVSTRRQWQCVGKEPGDDTESTKPRKYLVDLLDSPECNKKMTSPYIGESRECERVRNLIARAAKLDILVLILGDTGTGKEIVGHGIFDLSDKYKLTFVTANCAAIPETLFESIMFGHVKGSFTDAVTDHKGYWEQANNGTLFLDEIGELSLFQQAKILRAIEDMSIRPIGGTKDIHLSLRIIAATNRDLYSMVQTGQFRDDLYYRLSGFIIRTPSLRDHPNDIDLIANYLWKTISHDDKSNLPVDLIKELKGYHWPGNVRELKMILNTLNGLFSSDDKKALTADHLQFVFEMQGYKINPPVKSPDSAGQNKRDDFCNPIECFRHLNRIREAIYLSELTLKPILVDGKTDQATATTVHENLQDRLDELELLCHYPLRFRSSDVFDRINALRSKLHYFNSILNLDVFNAISFWDEKARPELIRARTDVQEEIKLIETSMGLAVMIK